MGERGWMSRWGGLLPSPSEGRELFVRVFAAASGLFVLLGLVIEWRRGCPELNFGGLDLPSWPRLVRCSVLVLWAIACLSVALRPSRGRGFRWGLAVLAFMGARASADGTCSQALSERVLTAVDLYHQGRTPLLVFSGGPGAGDVHEAEAMARLAEQRGVPRRAMLLDHGGVSTRATAVNLQSLLPAVGAQRVMVVSHAFHLPRVRLAFHFTGREILTVPAREGVRLTQLPWLYCRELGGFWAYFLREVAT